MLHASLHHCTWRPDADAELKERAAKVELMQAIVHFEFVRGTLLEARYVSISEKEPELSEAEDKEGDLLQLPAASGVTDRPNAPEFGDMLDKASPKIKKLLLDEEVK